jgi:nucleoside-diphosphate-sugar epimerase
MSAGAERAAERGSARSAPLAFLVTGASGFIGTHVVRELAKAGQRVFAMVRSPASAAALEPHAEAVRLADLRDPAALEAAVEGADVVVHLGGLTRAKSEAEFMETNAEGVLRLARAARARAPGLRRFVYVSSLSAGGPSEGAAARTEEDAPRPVSPYGRSKLAGEERLRDAADGMPWTILRPPIVYGPGERDLHTMFRHARRGWVPMVGFGDRAYSIVHARDLAGAILAVTASDAAAGQVYYVAEPRAYAGRELVAHIAAAIGTRARVLPVPHWVATLVGAAGSGLRPLLRRPPIVTLDKLPEIVRSWVCSPRKIERDCGFRCRIAFPEGAAETAAWYREAGWL